MKTLIVVVATLALAASTAQAQPRRPEQQAAEQGWKDYKEGKQPPKYYTEMVYPQTSTQYSYWSTYTKGFEDKKR
jgi:hypothetical protein